MLLAFLTVRSRCRCGTGAFVDEFWELSAIIEGSYRRQLYRSSEGAGWCHVTESIAGGGHCTR
jgi:hypothetical protein